MLSGIGPADHLIENDINPIVDLPGVGSSLADHVIASMQYSSDRNDLCHSKYQRIDKAFWLMANWLFNGKGQEVALSGQLVYFTLLKILKCQN